MTPTRKRRLIFAGLITLGVGAAVALALTAFQENILFFFSPSDIEAGKAPQGRHFRVGGLVVEGTVVRSEESLVVNFDLTDGAAVVAVSFDGILPDLFREGQGIVAEGELQPSGLFMADKVLAKHDENYMPPEVADALEAAKTLEVEP